MTKATEAKFSIKEVAQREGDLEQYLSIADRKAKVITRPK